MTGWLVIINEPFSNEVALSVEWILLQLQFDSYVTVWYIWIYFKFSKTSINQVRYSF